MGAWRRSPVAVVTAAGLSAVALCATAFGFWLGTGHGAGAAGTSALSVNLVALAGGDTPATALLPGSSAEVIVKVNNPTSLPLTLTSVTANGSVTTGQAGCSASVVTFTNQTGLSTPLAAHSATLVHLPGAATMSTAAASACQGATFTVPVTITARS